MESSKVYVNVMAEFTNDGRLLPRSFIWKDGHVYEIQKVTDVRRAASLKAGGAGIRYTCRGRCPSGKSGLPSLFPWKGECFGYVFESGPC